MKRILSVALATLFAVAMPAVQAQSIPSMEACVKYAEADAAYTTVVIEAQTIRAASVHEPIAAMNAATNEAYVAYEAARAAKQEAYVAYNAARGALIESGAASDDAAAREAQAVLEAASKEAHVAYEAAKQEADVAYEAAKQEAEAARTQTYLAIYAEGGGVQSDVWDVMVKLLTHQRELCTEHYGL